VKAAILHKPLEPMEVAEVELDDPRAGEVKVRMVASGVCHTCLHVIDGTLQGIATPIVLGDEGAGVVSDVGPGVERVKVGDHVVISWAPTCGRCRFCVVGRPVLCANQPPFGYLADGTTRMHRAGEPVYHFGPATYATEIVIPESCAIPVDPAIPLDKAALIGCSVMTGVGSVVRTADVPAGASVVVFGCGGIGLNAVQGAVIAGANPIIAVDIAESKLAYAESLGATHLVRGDQDPVGEIDRITKGGADYVVVAVGSAKAVAQAWDALAPGGTCVMLGVLSDGENVSVEGNKLMAKEVRLVGSRYGSARPSIDFPWLVDLYLSGKLKLDELISNRYPIEDANEAHRALAAGEVSRSLLVYE